MFLLAIIAEYPVKHLKIKNFDPVVIRGPRKLRTYYIPPFDHLFHLLVLALSSGGIAVQWL